ncbi:hypothetical protein DDB_G0286351 [Dictyostelium discoideum AX4]|uniref:Developmental gene 1062 protein n=2 Tax=Dictyostelium discoideum TaxID=44689 RepID=D1062_DICDI|nr:hypothetical protein DDB_G0286351 [Dictyostelium discoideum AX4]Q54LR0.1 RecName: Full=Developmental gene 1062 protein [Dictyostelium discoideum]EAL64200.1 hypothetical protein DDB_G0286351 [Dictyostelium discoideum AX4]|eukprot:XP_637770.1 hypothetical protein DDB_G0286351 [Dictyostelium discoideum AX4]
MIYNQALIEITKQGAVAVEEIKFSPPKLQTLISSIQNGGSPIINKNGSPAANALKNKQILQLQGQQQQQQQQQQNHSQQQHNNQSSVYSLNSLNPYYVQQVLCQLQKPHNFIKQVHVVVKNTPFGISMKSNDPQFNFHNYVIKATLLYDCDPPKMVDFIHNEPLQYVATVSEDGTEVVVDVKVGILSSQHQGSMFLAVLHISHTSVPSPSPNEPIMTILNNIGGNSIANLNSQLPNPIYNLCVVSHPIRIVSKVDHVKKEGIPILKKKTFHEILTDKLKKLQKFQDSQSKWIKNLYQQHLIEFDMEPYCSKKDQNNNNNNNNSNSNCQNGGGSICDDSSNSSTPSLSSYSNGNNKYNNNNNDSSESDESDDDDNNDDDDNDSIDFNISKQKNQQHLQQQLLNHQSKQQKVSSTNNNTTTTTSSSSASSIQQKQQPVQPQQQKQQNQSSNFQNSFNRVVEAFKYVPESERKDIITKMVEQLRSDDLEQLVATFMDELGVGDANSDVSSTKGGNNNNNNSIGCFCENCPSKKELERFQGLCMNFFVPQSTLNPMNNQQLLYSSLFSSSNDNNTQSQMNNSISVNNHHHHHHHQPNNSNLTNDLLQLPIV